MTTKIKVNYLRKFFPPFLLKESWAVLLRFALVSSFLVDYYGSEELWRKWKQEGPSFSVKTCGIETIPSRWRRMGGRRCCDPNHSFWQFWFWEIKVVFPFIITRVLLLTDENGISRDLSGPGVSGCVTPSLKSMFVLQLEMGRVPISRDQWDLVGHVWLGPFWKL